MLFPSSSKLVCSGSLLVEVGAGQDIAFNADIEYRVRYLEGIAEKKKVLDPVLRTG